MANRHHAHTYRTFEEFLSSFFNPKSDKAKRIAGKVWKQHVEKHGNVPMVVKCSVCSGKGHREDIKAGRWKESKETK